MIFDTVNQEIKDEKKEVTTEQIKAIMNYNSIKSTMVVIKIKVMNDCFQIGGIGFH